MIVKFPTLKSCHRWTMVVMGIALIVAAPILFVLSSVFVSAREVWRHLATTVLPSYIGNSLALMVGVSGGVLLIGVGTAWLVTMCRFPGSAWFEWALLLPLAAPAYLLAYTYTDMLDFYGPVQSVLRALFGWQHYGDYWFPNIRSLWGAITMMALVLYPYVYLLARVAFLEQGICLLEASRSLGCNPWRSFCTVAMPLARPAIMAGLALALMEALNDFGTVQFFGVSTFTTGIYRTWFNLGQRETAAQLASVLMGFILALIVLERWSRRQARYYQTASRLQALPSYHLSGLRAIAAMMACFWPLFLGFLGPALFLLYLTIVKGQNSLRNDFWALSRHSLFLATITAVLAVLLSLIMAYGQRLQPNFTMGLAVRTAAMGYAIPGSVIAVGTMIPMGQLDNAIDGWLRATFGISTGLLLSGTIFAMVFAYLVRFLAIAFGTVESSLGKIKPSLDEASRSLGYGPTSTLMKIHGPLIGGGMLTAGMLVFVDVMKELSATLVVRPFNFDTLAVRVYQYASDERLVEAAAPALTLVVVGMIPAIFLSWQIARSRSHQG